MSTSAQPAADSANHTLPIQDSHSDPSPTTAPSENSRGGPRTETGKATSSRNAVSHGLFAVKDFIRPDEQPLYAELAASLRAELAPEGPLELNLVDEIRGVMWRLRRCRQIEENFAAPDLPQSDPMQQESTARLQLSVDRARGLCHRLLHKCTAELRKLQTERQYRNEYFDAGTDTSLLGVCDLRFVVTSIANQQIANFRRQKLANIADVDAMLAAPYPATPGSFCNSVPTGAPATSQTPRNAPCPCGSGQKYKRCCGKVAPAILGITRNAA